MINRYKYIYECIDQCRPKTIVDIGVHDGIRSQKIIATAKHHNADIMYYGYDLWEDMRDEQVYSEFLHPKQRKTQQEADARIASCLDRSSFKLVKGDTRITLATHLPSSADFIYIDGGHSLETITSDWMNCSRIMHKETTVVFDDYWHGDKIAGCSTLIDSLDDRYNTELLGLDTIGDISNPKHVISLAKVTLRS